jgi:hypothetical protein
MLIKYVRNIFEKLKKNECERPKSFFFYFEVPTHFPEVEKKNEQMTNFFYIKKMIKKS